MMLVGNKCDLESEREVMTQEGVELAKHWNVPFVEASAFTRHNVDEAFFEIVRTIRSRVEDPSKKKTTKKSSGKKIAKLLGRKSEQCNIL